MTDDRIRRYTITLGDIGEPEETEEWQIEPLYEPRPVEVPEKVPA